MITINIELLEKFFLWMTIINFTIITFYFVLFVSAKSFIYKTQSRLFKMTKEKMDSRLYKILAYYKVATIAFNLVPYIALKIID